MAPPAASEPCAKRRACRSETASCGFCWLTPGIRRKGRGARRLDEPGHDRVAPATRHRPDLMHPVGRKGDEHALFTFQWDAEPGADPIGSTAMEDQLSAAVGFGIGDPEPVVEQDRHRHLSLPDPVRRYGVVGVSILMGSEEITLLVDVER